MAILRKIIAYIFWTLGVLIALAMLYFISSIVLGLIPVNKGYSQAEEGIEVFISTNGVHLDIIVPMVSEHKDWRQLIPPDHYGREYGQSLFIGFGWGERNFYIHTPTWADLKFSVAVKAMLWPTTTAMHVGYYKTAPRSNPKTIPLLLSENQYELLIDYIHGSFKMENDKAILIPGAGYDSDDNFYEAHGKYHLFYTSNEWVNQALKEIGVRTALWSPFDKAVLYQLGKIK